VPDAPSTPSGAAIYFDGTDTGAATPQIFNNIPSSKEHLLELRLDEGPIDEAEAYRLLDTWARAQGIEPAGA